MKNIYSKVICINLLLYVGNNSTRPITSGNETFVCLLNVSDLSLHSSSEQILQKISLLKVYYPGNLTMNLILLEKTVIKIKSLRYFKAVFIISQKSF